MSTVTLRSGETRRSGYDEHPGYRVWLEPTPKRLRVEFNGEVVADSTRAALLYESRHLPVYYFPREAIRWERFTATEHSTFCPFKGEASYWSLRVGERTAENALWGYPAPFDAVSELREHYAFYWNRVDRWLEEDEEVFVHPRDPHVRIDVLPSTRRVSVTLAGETVAESVRGVFLFETGLPTRYYLPREDVGAALERTETVTACPYKGRAEHYAVRTGGSLHPDVAWCYPDPVSEVGRIRGYVCFYHERVDSIALDGDVLEKPRTKWSPHEG